MVEATAEVERERKSGKLNISNPRQFNQLVIDRFSLRVRRKREREKIEEKQINKIKKIPLAFLFPPRSCHSFFIYVFCAANVKVNHDDDDDDSRGMSV